MYSTIDVILPAIISTIMTIPSMIYLYHKWIIPKVINGIRDTLPNSIIAIVDNKIDNFKEFLTLYIEEKITNLKYSALGSKGAKNRMINLAIDKLIDKGVTDKTISEISEKYGSDILQNIETYLKNKGNTLTNEKDPFQKLN